MSQQAPFDKMNDSPATDLEPQPVNPLDLPHSGDRLLDRKDVPGIEQGGGERPERPTLLGAPRTQRENIVTATRVPPEAVNYGGAGDTSRSEAGERAERQLDREYRGNAGGVEIPDNDDKRLGNLE